MGHLYTKYKVLFHILFWLFAWAISTFIWGNYTGDFLKMFYILGIYLPLEVLSVYITIYYLFPRHFLSDQRRKFVLYFFAMTLVLCLVQRGIQMTIVGKLFYPGEYREWDFFNIGQLYSKLIWFYLLDAMALVVKLSKHYYQKSIENSKIAEEKLQAELKLLRSQIHPHFLFNTLNNLYSLALDKSDSTAEGIIKLSDLLSYMLYDCNDPYITLDKELKLIEDYIELEKLRYGKKLRINVDISGNTAGIKIAPMLILPFVENSFKHGTSTKLDEMWINIELISAINAIELKVENNRSVNVVDDDHGYTEGIGLKNVKRRLELLYNGGYNLDIYENEHLYRIHLHLEL